MIGLKDDLRHTWRVYRGTPFQSALAILTLGVAIAFATAFFSLYSDLSFRSLPGGEDARSLGMLGLSEGGSFDSLPNGMYGPLAEQTTSLRALEAFLPMQFEPEEPETPEPLVGAGVTADYFTELGIGIAHGRPLDESDRDARVVVLSHEAAEKLFDDAAAAVNQEIMAHDMSLQVVGVTEPGFEGLVRGTIRDIWLPREVMLNDIWGVPEEFHHQVPAQMIARLADGVSPAAAEVELNQIADGFDDELRAMLRSQSIRLVPQMSNSPDEYRATQQQLQLMAGAAILVALIAAGNLGLFLLARAPARQREMALRLTVGARPARLVRQLMTEAFALVLVGTGLGLLLALWLGVFLQDLPLFDGGQFLDQGLDWRIPLFAAGLATVLALVVGTAPALGLARQSLAAHSRGAGRSLGARHVIATVQVVLALVIVAGGLYAQHSLRAALSMDPGYDMAGISQANPVPAGSMASFRATDEAIRDFRQGIRERLNGVDGIRNLGFAGRMPGSDHLMFQTIRAADDAEIEAPGIAVGWDPDAMDILGLRLLHGQLPEEPDRELAVVNRHLAEQFWGRTDVVGEFVEQTTGGFGGSSEAEPMEIVAVVEDIHFGHPRDPMRPTVLLADGGMAYFAALLIDGEVNREQLDAAIGEFLLNHEIPLEIERVQSLEDAFTDRFAQDRSRVWMTGLGAVIVLIMAVLGFYGTLRFLMQGHRFEFALRSAVGAGPGSLYKDAMRHGLTLAAPGLLIGLPIAVLAVVSLSDYLGAMDARVWPAALMAAVLLTAALVLAIHPIARQAAGQDPAPALRGE